MVPALRAEVVWQVVNQRCKEANITLGATTAQEGRRFAVVLGGAGSLGLVTWGDLLSNILSSVKQAGEQMIASDVRQLQGLCDLEDSEAFLPLQSAELTDASFPRRVVQFCNVVDDLATRLIGLGVADAKGLRATTGKGRYGRYLRIRGIASIVYFSTEMWASKYSTPSGCRRSVHRGHAICVRPSMLDRRRSRLDSQSSSHREESTYRSGSRSERSETRSLINY